MSILRQNTFPRPPELPDAILALRPGCSFSLSMAMTAQGNLDYDWGTLAWTADDISPPTEEEAKAKLVELQAEYDLIRYRKDRFDAYPKIEEQLALIYDDIIAGKDLSSGEWIAAINAVKEQYPKPS